MGWVGATVGETVGILVGSYVGEDGAAVGELVDGVGGIGVGAGVMPNPQNPFTCGNWHPTAISLARKFDAPVIPLAVRQRMPFLYYALAQINEELKDMTVFQGLIDKRRSKYRLQYGRPMTIGKDDGTDAEVTRMFRGICERMAWGK